MRALFALLIVITTALAAFDPVDLVGTDNALYVAWGKHLRIWGTATERSFGSSCSVSLGLANLNGQDVLLHTRCSEDGPDSLFILDPFSLETVSSRQVLPWHLANLSLPSYALGSLRLSRHQPEPGSFYLSGNPFLSVAGYTESNTVSARFEYSNVDGIVISDTLGTRRYSNYSGAYYGLTAPVFSGTNLPMVFWTFYETYYNALLTEYAAIHIMNGDPVPGDYEPILYDSIYHAEGVFTAGEIKCSGASSDEVVVLWTKEYDENLFCSVFNCTGVTPVSSMPLTAPPEPASTIALSRNPSDSGMLLVWSSTDSIQCRYRESSEWNPWVYTVDSINGEIIPGALRVCGVTDGYWVCWLMNWSDEPVVRFVSRPGVATVSETAEPVTQRLQAFPNPCNSSITISSAVGEFQSGVTIFDLSGRVVDTVLLDEDGGCVLATGMLEQGTYLVHAAGQNYSETLKLIVIH